MKVCIPPAKKRNANAIIVRLYANIKKENEMRGYCSGLRSTTLAVFAIVIVAQANAATASNGLAILFTDYDSDSIYVGALKGAMYAKAPNIKIDTLTNSVPNFDIVTGAYLLVEGSVTYPAGTSFCCVVDPTVGSPRRPIALETKNGWRFVAPDNGLLTLVAERYGVAEVRACENKELWRTADLSYTFQGRDVFGPVTAALASGVPMEKVGPKIDDMVKLELPRCVVEGDTARGVVIRTDGYGNVVTNIHEADATKAGIKKGDTIEVTLGKEYYTALFVNTYSDVKEGERLVAIQSAGYVELSINKGSLSEKTGEGVKAKVVIRKATPKK
jgi:S-adenosylmethionine hydrolase